mgnify:CR=1 FL=1
MKDVCDIWFPCYIGLITLCSQINADNIQYILKNFQLLVRVTGEMVAQHNASAWGKATDPL